MIVPHNLTNKIQRLDLSVNKAVATFLIIRYPRYFKREQILTKLKHHRHYHYWNPRGWYIYDVHDNCSIFKNSHPLSIYVQSPSTPLTLDVQFQTTFPLFFLQIITNQLKENMIQGYSYVINKARYHQRMVSLTSKSNGIFLVNNT